MSHVGRVAQGPKALEETTASPSIQIRLDNRNRIYVLEYQGCPGLVPGWV